MARYEYWMVYLPEVTPASFLLFVVDSTGANKLRSYASGREQIIGQPGSSMVFSKTKFRFRVDPHRVDGAEGCHHWHHETLNHNRRYLAGVASQQNVIRSLVNPPIDGVVQGRGNRGSQRQIQDYVNSHQLVLTQAILERLPPRLQELGATIRWVSPLADENYREYRDGEFLERVGLGHFTKVLGAFWPNRGPSWDALGIVLENAGVIKPEIVLVEAKSYPREVYGNGCQATQPARDKIGSALQETKVWCKVARETDWLGPLYQSANRIAHLYFLLELLHVPAWLVNLYFTADPIGPTTREGWEQELMRSKSELGLTQPVRNLVEYISALSTRGSTLPPCRKGSPSPIGPIGGWPWQSSRGRHYQIRKSASRVYWSYGMRLFLARGNVPPTPSCLGLAIGEATSIALEMASI
jgi:hypothetical protein